MDLESSDQASARESRDDDSVTKPSPGTAASALPQPAPPPESGNFGISAFSRLTSGFSFRSPSFPAAAAAAAAGNEAGGGGTESGGVLESFAKGVLDTSRNAVKAVQVKARHVVSQNKRRYQEGGFDLDMAYITENVIAMGFPAGDLSSGILGFFEGFYRNHMEEVIKFFETHHKGKYKVYNLCSERLYDASRFQGKVACFPFDDHNCPPIHLIMSFCQSAHSWLKEDIENVVVVHCKAGMGRTGLMICSFLLFLKFFPTAEEAIEYFNQKRCIDGKALVLPSQIRYVKYFEHIRRRFNGEIPPGRRCMLRGFRFLKCPYWIRPSITISNHSGVLFSTKKHPKTKNLMPEDFWITAPKKGIAVFAVPGEPGLTEVAGDFKIHFHDHLGDFYCWLNTTMTENRTTLTGSEFDGFDKRKIPSPGFQVEIVMIDFDGTYRMKPKVDSASKGSGGSSSSDYRPLKSTDVASHSKSSKVEKEDDVFSDSDGEEETVASTSSQAQASSSSNLAQPGNTSDKTTEEAKAITSGTEQLSLTSQQHAQVNTSKEPTAGAGEFRNQDSTAGAYDIMAIAADASVFSFGDEEDFESD